MPIVNGIEKSYGDLTDEEIYILANEQWEALPIKKRTSVKSIEICEDMFILRKMYKESLVQ